MNDDQNRSINPFDILTEHLKRIESLVTDIKRNQERDSNAGLPEDEVSGIELAMRITGLEKRSIYNLISKRDIPHSKKGNRLYFSKKELIEWKMSGKRRTTEEIRGKYGFGSKQ